MNDTTEARPAAPSDAHHYTLTVEETAQRYKKAGVPRTIRRIQKYCARGDLDCKKVETDFGEKYFISEESIERHIAQIKDAQDAAGRNFQDLYIQQLETEVAFLRDQTVVLLERVKETNVLTQGLQRLLSPLLRSPEKSEDDKSATPN